MRGTSLVLIEIQSSTLQRRILGDCIESSESCFKFKSITHRNIRDVLDRTGERLK